jgi:hypothetical protein
MEAADASARVASTGATRLTDLTTVPLVAKTSSPTLRGRGIDHPRRDSLAVTSSTIVRIHLYSDSPDHPGRRVDLGELQLKTVREQHLRELTREVAVQDPGFAHGAQDLLMRVVLGDRDRMTAEVQQPEVTFLAE